MNISGEYKVMSVDRKPGGDIRLTIVSKDAKRMMQLDLPAYPLKQGQIVSIPFFGGASVDEGLISVGARKFDHKLMDYKETEDIPDF